MKKFKLFLLCLILILLGRNDTLTATNYPFSKWLHNLSEGQGEEARGWEEFNPELAVEGNTIHTMWMSWDNASGGSYVISIHYKRSTDGGLTWDKSVELARPAYGNLDYDRREKRMYVYGDNVHIFYISKNGDGKRAVFYHRSTDGGKSFEEVQQIYVAEYWIIDDLRVSGDDNKINIIFRHDCSGCGGVPTMRLMHSDDQGASFVERLLPEKYQWFNLRDWDMKTKGDNIFFTATKTIGPWYNYDHEMYLIKSHDNGLTFSDVILSVPALTGLHHTFAGMDSGWGYLDKIVVSGNRVGVVWSGWNENNACSVFLAISDDGGVTFPYINQIATDIPTLAIGHEACAINGDEVYVSFLTQASKIYVVKSSDGGKTFADAYEITQPTHGHASGAWGPAIKANTSGSGAVITGTGPIAGIITPESDEMLPFLLGNYSLPTKNTMAEIDDDGNIHLLFIGGNSYLNAAGFSDFDLYYRKIESDPQVEDDGDNVLNLRITPNTGEITGEERYDNMAIPRRESMVFTEAITIELWVKRLGDESGRILTQYAHNTWNAWNPVSFQLWTNDYDPEEIICGLWTTSGAFVIPSGKKLKKNYWSHIAVTYDVNGDGDNFKLYMNGQLVASALASGQLVADHGPWILGSVENDGRKYGFDADIDELRFWGKALSEAELKAGMFNPLMGDETGLKAYYNFNGISAFGQLRDASDNGNTAFLMYNEDLTPSTIIETEVSFDYIQKGSEVYFNQDQGNCEGASWSLGDGNTSSLINPLHTYSQPGVYEVCLEAYCGDMIGLQCQSVTVNGIDRVLPLVGGNRGTSTIRIYGGGFNESSVVKLVNSSRNDIEASHVEYVEPDLLLATFDLLEKTIGAYQLQVDNGSSSIVAERAFEVEQGEDAQPWANISGPGNVLINKWTDFTITYGNESNQDAYMVPLKVFFKGIEVDALEMDFIDVKFKPFPGLDEDGNPWIKDLLPYVQVNDDPVVPEVVYPMIIPHIPPKFKNEIRLRVKTTLPLKVELNTTVTGPLALTVPRFAGDTTVFKGAKCFASLAAQVALDAALGGEAAAIENCLKDLYANWTGGFDNYRPKQKATFYREVTNWAIVLADCGVTAAKVGGKTALKTNPVYLTIKSLSSLNTLYGYYTALLNCLDIFIPGAKEGILYYVLYSFDPNEKYGPTGPGEEHYIYPPPVMSYRITYENKSDATAPAQQVVIYDTLDLNRLDTSRLQFGSVGFADTTIMSNPDATSFAADVDLRPEKELIVRITGALQDDGVIKWVFTSLDPETMQLTDDAFGGFLDPNVESPEGEGFVSFTIGLKDPIADGDQVRNRAAIVFDYNEPIITNYFVNTFDLEPPESEIVAEKAVYGDTSVLFNIVGNDTGSGIDYYFIYAAEDDGDFEFYKVVDTSTFEFVGRLEHNYKMYSIAVDHAGWMEEDPGIADIEVRLSTGVSDIESSWPGFEVYPVPAMDHIVVRFDNPKSGFITCSVVDLTGRTLTVLMEGEVAEGFLQFDSNLNLQPGIYMIRLQHGDFTDVRKIIIMNPE
jgi:hypothetical protein